MTDPRAIEPRYEETLNEARVRKIVREEVTKMIGLYLGVPLVERSYCTCATSKRLLRHE